MSDSWQDRLDGLIGRRFDQMVEIRRWLHTFPELSGDERQTSLRLYQLLDEEGFRVRMGPDGRGVLADLSESATRPAHGIVAIRAEIDALRIHDEKQDEYRSHTEGVMHACGHDAHSALVFGALCALKDLQEQGHLPWELRLRGIFQPSEETSTGALEMIGVGAIEGAEAILATHLDPSRQLGRIGLRAGVFTANCDGMQVDIAGRGGHAARPHEAIDPIAAAAQLINALYLFVPRAADSQDAVVVTVGQLVGGDNPNVIPERVMLRGTIRTLDETVRQDTFDHIRRLAAGIGQTTGTRIAVRFGQGCHSIRNHRQLTDLAARSGAEILGADGVEWIARPSMGSEDFAFYAAKIPALMFRLGCTSDRAGGAPLHSPLFDLDERALAIGAKILARTAAYCCAPEFRLEPS